MRIHPSTETNGPVPITAGCEPRSDPHRDAEQWRGLCMVRCALFETGGRTEGGSACEEWKVDVPTIGRVYAVSHMRVVCYLSGLGRPFSFEGE